VHEVLGGLAGRRVEWLGKRACQVRIEGVARCLRIARQTAFGVLGFGKS
jgi:hypothetical protein